MASPKPNLTKKTAKPAGKKATPATEKGAVKKGKAAAAKAKPAEKPVKELEMLTEGTFAKFTGYVASIPEEDRIFEKGEVVYISAVHPAQGDQPSMYDAIKAADLTLFLEDEEHESVRGAQIVVQEASGLAGRALAEARDNFMPIPTVGRLEEILEDHAGDLMATARGLFEEIEQSFFYLGGVLAKIRREGAYLVENGGEYEGETAWNDFCEGEFGFGGAKGGDLARIYVTFSAIPDFDATALEGIGWSKIRELQRYATPENYVELLDEARDSTRSDLKIKLVEKFADPEGKTPAGKAATRGASAKTLALTLKLPEAAHEAVQLVLAEAQKKYGVATPAEALERIMMVWAEENIDSATKQKSVTKKLSASRKTQAAAA